MRLCLVLVLVLAAVRPAGAQDDGPFFLYLGSFSTKAAAQEHAARNGAWVLRSDLYQDLAPGYFATVLGPFSERGDAEVALASYVADFPDAFVRTAGPSLLPPALGDPALLAAVLGDLVVVTRREPDDTSPCAPEEPYLTVLVGFDQTHGQDTDAPAAGFWVIERTGEIRPFFDCTD